jgi:hypothetical protein
MRVLHLIAVLVLCLTFGVSQASAAQARRETASREVKPATLNFHGILGRLGGLLTAIWTKEGCGIDPLGGCAPSMPTSDSGCTIDPLGGCATNTSNSDAGCVIDPWGSCGPKP